MPVYKMNKLPPDHPFAQGLIVFGAKRPASFAPPSPTPPGASTPEPEAPLVDKSGTPDSSPSAAGQGPPRQVGK